SLIARAVRVPGAVARKTRYLTGRSLAGLPGIRTIAREVCAYLSAVRGRRGDRSVRPDSAVHRGVLMDSNFGVRAGRTVRAAVRGRAVGTVVRDVRVARLAYFEEVLPVESDASRATRTSR